MIPAAFFVQAFQEIGKAVRHPLIDNIVVHGAELLSDFRLNVPTKGCIVVHRR